MARIVVCGYMIRYPLAGNVMAFYHYLYGLRRLGHDVLYLEESGWPNSCYNPVEDTSGDDPAYGIRYVEALMARFGVACPLAFVDRQRGPVAGPGWADLRRALRAADLLLNVGGVCWLDEFRLCGRRALVDLDPFFTQIGRFGAEGHGEYEACFSYGVNIGTASCTIPTGGIDWVPTVPPVAPELWRDAAASGRVGGSPAFTTIANWSAYGDATYEGEQYGQKDREFVRIMSLPAMVRARLELAVGGASDEMLHALRASGWSVREALEVSVDMATYGAYIGSSLGELSVAKHAYVKTRSGWFSDRSVCYLAAGRPVILQDSGFTDWLPTGRGVLAFSSLDDAVCCVDDVCGNVAAHSRAAREIAEEVFGYRNVLPRLLERAGGRI